MRIDTSLLRAACWTMASGMRLANHMKFQCGEIRKFDLCCEILSEAGAPCESRFQSKRALRRHQLRSNLHGHGRLTSVFSSVITNYCPWCCSRLSTTLITRKHAAASMLSGQCRVDADAFPWPISPPESLQCSLCDDTIVYTSIEEFFRSFGRSPFAQATSCEFADGFGGEVIFCVDRCPQCSREQRRLWRML